MSRLRRVWIAVAIGLSCATPAIAGPAPQRPGVVDVYFVGFAAWGSQDVFLSEARGAAEVVASAYGSPERATLLSNEVSSGLPAATRTSLRGALAETARVMDRDEDVLFLLLTSHGSPRGVGLERGGKVFDLLSPNELRRALEASGVRNAVVVVSACYSGVFRSVATTRRLVVMAARPDRPSFGCKDGNRWTYFGEAFFDGALRKEADLRRAFATAKDAVARRERAEGFTPSEPQIAGGRGVVERLSAAGR
ncbi:peptidase C13, legumain asparaginyl peptidase [Chelatococcus sambhunathii]|uniref:Peptidase C13, legumain asparaginyl peptidase n=1 Tax=Chelatococcus sambhunathii TaxID=363953 RepID=A0ABU1DB07_9HYPH|nr:C13 family peptidase [Chelatococcus sambhunathii]MDR4305291.1 peptidase C13, legumain asparaginyl peptidase [Chelatococcus sambhunathii]